MLEGLGPGSRCRACELVVYWSCFADTKLEHKDDTAFCNLSAKSWGTRLSTPRSVGKIMVDIRCTCALHSSN